LVLFTNLCFVYILGLRCSWCPAFFNFIDKYHGIRIIVGVAIGARMFVNVNHILQQLQRFKNECKLQLTRDLWIKPTNNELGKKRWSLLLLALSLKPISQCLCDKDLGMLHKSYKSWMTIMGRRPNRMWKKNIGNYYSWKMNVGCGNHMETEIKKWHGGVPPHLAIGLYFGNPKYQIVMTIMSTFSLLRKISWE
jgi:hypothetical protein